MKRKEREPLKTHLVRLFAGDFERMQELHAKIGATRAIRELIRGHIRRVEETAAQKESR